MEPRLSLVTLGVEDISRARRFYEEGLGWPVSEMSNDKVVFFQVGGLILGLYGREALARDADLPASSWQSSPIPGAFRGVALAQNVRSPEEVDQVLQEALKAGGSIAKPGEEAFWGGYSGYFTDPEGHLWEVAWNPAFTLTDDGRTLLPG